jgi:bifunctional DNA-binding transcriptional regulator/antitoxin component of YhaV-PrlF toxin-antitoxin module
MAEAQGTRGAGGRGERVERISAGDARRRVAEGRAVLVCAYEDEERCRRLKLERAHTLRELEAGMSTLSRDQEIVFYCA